MEINSSLFFEFIDIERPYHTPIDTKEWMTLAETSISLKGLVTTQSKLGIIPLLRSVLGHPSIGCIDQVPHIVYYDGKYWISDGHHRLAAGMLKGKKKLKVRLYGG